MKKVALVASVGGHLAQILQLKNVINDYDVFLVTEQNYVTSRMQLSIPVYYLRLNNRRSKKFIPNFIINSITSARIFMVEKPHVVISTGANSSIPLCLIAKALGAKVIFIESLAKVKTPTFTGKLIYKFADLFIVQWPGLLRYYPKAQYGGGIF